MKAFVTGGSGFIGGALIRRLRNEGVEVSALARSEGSAAKVADAGAEPARGDLDDVDAMAAGAEGCELAFHAAAALGEWGRREDFERGNVQGTRNALEAARRAGVRRFVHVGTEAALMAGEPLVDVDETTPLRPDSKALYPATKAQAEMAVREANGGAKVDVVLEMVGGRVFDQSLSALAPFGRLVFYGMAGRDAPTPIAPAMLLGTSAGVLGFWLVHCLRRPEMIREPIRELLDMAASGDLRPVAGAAYPLSEARAAHEDMRARRTIGKVVLDPSA